MASKLTKLSAIREITQNFEALTIRLDRRSADCEHIDDATLHSQSASAIRALLLAYVRALSGAS